MKLALTAKPLRALMPKQTEGTRYLTRMFQAGLGGLLFKEMRLGKTATFIRFTKILSLPGPFLVICPNTVKNAWENELIAESEFNYVIMQGTKEDKKKILNKNYKWFILNYESAVPSLNRKKELKVKRLGIEIELFQWFAIILDESIKIANASSTAKFFLHYFPHVKYKYCLCGKPCPEGERQYVQQFIFVFGHFMGYKDLWHFTKAHYLEHGYQLIPKLGTKQTIYKYVHQYAFVCTRKEAGVGGIKISAVRYIEMNTAQKKAYKEMDDKWTYKEIYTKYKLSQRIFLHKLCSGFDISTADQWLCDNKLNEILYLLNTELKGEQVLIWVKFRHELEYLYKNLSAKFKTRFINGDIPSDTREAYRKDFFSGKYQIQLATIESLAKGTDWSIASTFIYFSMDDSGDDMGQSGDRGIHPMKKEPILLIYLLTKGTVDIEIYDNVKRKETNSSFFMSKLYQRVLDK